MTTHKHSSEVRLPSISNKEEGEKPSSESEMFAASLRAWRLSRGLTQDELAVVAGVSKSSISMAERAFHYHPPKEITQSRLAQALGISLQELRMLPTGFDGRDRQMLAPVSMTETGRGVQRIAASKLNAKEMDGISLPAKWVLGSTDEPADLSYLIVTDAAMQPTIRMGDVAVLEPFDSTAPGIYLVGARDSTGITPIGIRRVTPTSSGNVRLSCDNERFDRTPSNATGKIVLLSKVLFVVRAIDPE